MKCITFLFIATLLASCSPVNRIERTLSRYPKALAHFQISKDTNLIFIDTVITNYFHFDTFKVMNRIDSVIISKKNATTKVFRNNDRIDVQTEVFPDTIIKIDTLSFHYKIQMLKLNNKYAWQRTLRKGSFWIVLILGVGGVMRFILPLILKR